MGSSSRATIGQHLSCGSREATGQQGKGSSQSAHQSGASDATAASGNTSSASSSLCCTVRLSRSPLLTPRLFSRWLIHSPNLAPIRAFNLNNCPVYYHHPTVTKPSSRIQTVLVPNFRTPRSPRNLTRHPRDYGLRPFRPARALEATPAYPDSKAAPGPTSFRRPPWPITPRRAAPAYLHSNGHRCPSTPSASLTSLHASPSRLPGMR